MHIDYKALLPASRTCDHNQVRWKTKPTEDPSAIPDDVQTIEVPEGTPGAHSIKVEAECKDCPTETTKTLYYVHATNT